MLKIFEPPESVEPQDVDKMVAAGLLCDIFTNAAMLEADARGLHNDIKATMGKDGLEKISRIAKSVNGMFITNKEEFAWANAQSIFLNDIFLAAAVDHIPQEILIQSFPQEAATEEWADLFERYDMYTTATLIRACMPRNQAP